MALAAAVLAFPAMPARAYEYHEFSQAKEQVLATVRTIALRPVALPARFENREAIQRQFETELTAALVAAGFRVVPGADFDAVWRQNARRLGGVFDIVTGELADDKFNTCYEYTARELARLYDVDAIAILALTPGAVQGGFARQHHGGYLAYAVGDPVVIGGKELRTSRFDELQVIYGGHFEFGLYDLAGLSLYSTKVPVDWYRIYWNRSYIQREEPPLSNPTRNSAAVREAVRPLQRSAADSNAASKPAESASDAASPDGTKPAASRPSDAAQ
jgi:hypothetical protein